MASATVYTDGACIDQGTGNSRAGYGVFWGDDHKNNRFGRVTGPQDSNRAELRAAHQAIKTASRNGYAKIKICTDSSYVVETVRNAQNYQISECKTTPQRNPLTSEDIDQGSDWQQKNLQPSYQFATQGIHDMSKKINVSVAYIKGHSGVHGNEQANMLAKAGANL